MSSKNKQLFGIMGIAVVLCIAVGSAPTQGASTKEKVTKANIDSHPFVFKIITEDREDDLIWFRVAVAPRADDGEPWCVSGAVRVMKKEEEVGSFGIVESLLNKWSDLQEPQWSWIFGFTISRKYLENSRFMFFNSHCEMPAFNGYWLILEEFYQR